MTLDYDDLLNSIMASLDRTKQVEVNDIPNIDLYMDQLLTFMEENLRKSARHPGVDKILTKTMINNYAKNDLLPPPIKKKYSKDHIILLIYIYYYKNILSFSDIQTLFEPLYKRFGNDDAEINLKDIYTTIYDAQDEIIAHLKEDIKEKYGRAQESFPEAKGEDKDELQMLTFISMLSYDVFIKMLLIENIIDHIQEERGDTNKKKKKK
ncbi:MULTISPECIES: DUF1836 domain-containing protein [unclassified Butyrivibrio]|jgi:hypothetical protein|uniref:DUF1836 domain-containing protein n=1 Tax=unclassified Butyrivibrio TaxID=2639466 RepID=UPI000406B030|nr:MULTISPECIES: DUF1836 domain-containing protein [unclassified Butyrivibrio]MCR5343015.1 DUF1836 domain-containing protein [Butyrivibrio sp.]